MMVCALINLIAKSIIRQFDVPKARAGEVLNDGVEELIALAGKIELEEEVMRTRMSEDENNEDDIEDDIEDWQDEQLGMSNKALKMLNDDVQPV